MASCRHKWSEPVNFVGDPWSTYCPDVMVACVKCGKQKTRCASSDERARERERLTCQVCGFKNELHGQGTDVPGLTCITLLSSRVRELEDRLFSIENWRSG